MFRTESTAATEFPNKEFCRGCDRIYQSSAPGTGIDRRLSENESGSSIHYLCVYWAL
jgi:hypothetical protein